MRYADQMGRETVGILIYFPISLYEAACADEPLPTAPEAGVNVVKRRIFLLWRQTDPDLEFSVVAMRPSAGSLTLLQW